MKKFDLIVIGAGPGGYVAAIKAAQLGKSVAVVERGRLGGTCTNRGCIPTKALMHAAEVMDEISAAAETGIRVPGVECDFAAMHERKRRVVERLVDGIGGLFKGNGVELFGGTATLEGQGRVKVNTAQGAAGEVIELEAENVLIATGSEPYMPSIPGIELPGVVTSTEMLEGDGVKSDRLLIIGGGVIGIEMATLYRSLGAEVTVIEAAGRILPSLDREISQNMSMILRRRGIKISTGATVTSIERSDDGLSVNYTAKDEAETVSGDNVLVAIGRKVNTDNILADGVSLEMERGRIVTDENFETSLKSVYAVGDIVAGGIQLAHAASAEGINAVCAMFGEDRPKDLTAVPSAIYTNPEIACVGVTEAEAAEQGVSVIVGKAMNGGNAKTIISSGDRGYAKLIYDAADRRLIGAQLVCIRATDMVGALTDAVVNGLTVEDMDKSVWLHPSFSEIIGEAVESAAGGAIHAMPKKRK